LFHTGNSILWRRRHGRRQALLRIAVGAHLARSARISAGRGPLAVWRLGGRASEELNFGKISTGAQNDLQQITRMAYAMVTVYGMNEKIGNVSFYDPSAENSFTKPYSEETSKIIDEEVRKLIESAYDRTKSLLVEKQEQVSKLAEALLDKEVLFQSDVESLIGRRPFEDKHLLDVEPGEKHPEGGISEGVPPYDPNVTNQAPAAK
jgi:cell division protease FtsH